MHLDMYGVHCTFLGVFSRFSLKQALFVDLFRTTVIPKQAPHLGVCLQLFISMETCSVQPRLHKKWGCPFSHFRTRQASMPYIFHGKYYYMIQSLCALHWPAYGTVLDFYYIIRSGQNRIRSIQVILKIPVMCELVQVLEHESVQ